MRHIIASSVAVKAARSDDAASPCARRCAIPCRSALSTAAEPAAPATENGTAALPAAEVPAAAASDEAAATPPPPPPPAVSAPAPPVEHDVVISKPCSEEGKVVHPQTTTEAVH